jgi:hypothetical protein
MRNRTTGVALLALACLIPAVQAQVPAQPTQQSRAPECFARISQTRLVNLRLVSAITRIGDHAVAVSVVGDYFNKTEIEVGRDNQDSYIDSLIKKINACNSGSNLPVE